MFKLLSSEIFLDDCWLVLAGSVDVVYTERVNQDPNNSKGCHHYKHTYYPPHYVLPTLSFTFLAFAIGDKLEYSIKEDAKRYAEHKKYQGV